MTRIACDGGDWRGRKYTCQHGFYVGHLIGDAPMRFRKKPIVVEAVRWLESHLILERPEWFKQALRDGRLLLGERELKVVTLEGVMTAKFGDWIIQGVHGELYPCRPDIFEKTYEPVE